MSVAEDPTDGDESDSGPLTEEERENFERLADEYEDDVLGEVFELVLQSSEEASS